MLKALTASEAKSKLGSLLDRVDNGEVVYLRFKKRIYWIKPVAEAEPPPNRPFGFFAVEESDPMVAMANSAFACFTPTA